MTGNEEAIRTRAAIGARFKEVQPIIVESLDAVEAEYAAALLNCFDSAERDNLWRAVQVCRKVKAHVGSLVSGGSLATHQLTEIRRLK